MNSTGGAFTPGDLANYKVRWLKPLTSKFMGYDVSMMPPPSSGGVVIAQALKLVEKTKLAEKTESLSVPELHGLIEIEKLSYRIARNSEIPISRKIPPTPFLTRTPSTNWPR